MGIKVFSVDEANELLPVIREMILRLQQDIRDIVATQDALSVLGVLGADDPGSPEHKDFATRQIELEEQVQAYNERLEEIHAEGCVVKDLNSGVVDFYGLKDGRLVFLCWRMGESAIGYWHEVDTGMAGRRPLSEL